MLLGLQARDSARSYVVHVCQNDDTHTSDFWNQEHRTQERPQEHVLGLLYTLVWGDAVRCGAEHTQHTIAS